MHTLKKISIVGVVCFIINFFIFRIIVVCWRGDYSWEEMEFEYVGETHYKQVCDTKELGMTPPLTINAVQIREITNSPKDREIRCFFEIRNEADWEYVKNVLNIKNCAISLDFSYYYLISINREVEKVEFNKQYCTIEKYGHDIRGKNKDDSYVPGTIYIYKMKDKITFYYKMRNT